MADWIAIITWSIVVLLAIGLYVLFLWLLAIVTRKVRKRRYKPENDKGRKSSEYRGPNLSGGPIGHSTKPLPISESFNIQQPSSSELARNEQQLNNTSESNPSYRSNVRRIKEAFRKGIKS